MRRLGLDDLITRSKTGRESTKLMNVKVPAGILERLDAVATKTRATKTEVVISILNEGLDKAEQDLKGWTPPPKIVIPKARRCSVQGCPREKVALGLCATHYQAQR